MNMVVLTRWLRFAAATTLIIVSLFWLFVGYRLLSGASNHIGFDLWWMRAVAVTGMVLFGVLWMLARRNWALIAGALCGLSLAGSYALDRHNILVPYEVWLKRGMPERMAPTPAPAPLR